MKRETKATIYANWEWVKENKLLIILVIAGVAVNFIPMEMIVKFFLIAGAISFVSWIYYIVRLKYLRNKLIKLTGGVIDENDKIRKILKSQSAQIKYLQGKPVTFMDESGNIRTMQKGKDDDTIMMN